MHHKLRCSCSCQHACAGCSSRSSLLASCNSLLTRALSSKTCVAARSHSAAAAAAGARRARQHCIVACLASPSQQQGRPDAATFQKQVQLSKELSSMKYGRWREVIPN
eukprot:20043-Heterococcus_DN1.PRE.1